MMHAIEIISFFLTHSCKLKSNKLSIYFRWILMNVFYYYCFCENAKAGDRNNG